MIGLKSSGNLNSYAGLCSVKGHDIYCATKFGLRAFSDVIEMCGCDIFAFYPKHINNFKRYAEDVYIEVHRWKD